MTSYSGFIICIIYMMLKIRKLFYFLLLIVIISPACGNYSYKVKTVKPISRYRYYKPKKHKHKKRVKIVKKRVN